MSSDLTFVSTQELIAELLRRTSFLGVIVHSEEEHRGEWQGDTMFNVRFNSNLTAEEASRLLDTVAEYMDLNPR